MKFAHEFRLDHADDHTRVYISDGVRMRIDFLQDMLRVALIRNDDLLPTFSIDPENNTDAKGRDKLSLDSFVLCKPEVREEGGIVKRGHRLLQVEAKALLRLAGWNRGASDRNSGGNLGTGRSADREYELVVSSGTANNVLLLAACRDAKRRGDCNHCVN